MGLDGDRADEDETYMEKIMLATDIFPYGTGEKSFIMPELRRLSGLYEITVISHAGSEVSQPKTEEKLPDGVKCVTFPRPVLSVKDKLKALFCYLTDCDGYREIWEIICSKHNIGKRLYQSLSFYAQALSDQRTLEKSGLLLKEENVVYYSYWYTYFCYSMIRLKRRYPNISVLTRTHGHDLYHERIPGNRQPFKHQMEKKLNKIVFACAYGKEYYSARVKHPKTCTDKLCVCRLGTESAGRRMPYRETDEFHVLSCSNVIDLKRIELIVDGLAQIKDLRVRWTHIGNGEAYDRIAAYAAEKLADRSNICYELKGYMENENVHRYYEEHQIDCFITTSSTEGGCPVSVQEAMSYGVPVIGTDVGGITEMLGGNGILLSNSPDGTAVAEAIRYIATLKRSDYEMMQERSRSVWREQFDIQLTAMNFRRVLEEITG